MRRPASCTRTPGPFPYPTVFRAPGDAAPDSFGGGDTFDRAIPEFAAAYADQNEDDYRALKRAADDGRIAVESERE